MDSEKILDKIKQLQSAPQNDKFVLFELVNTSHSIYYGVDSNKHPVFVLPSLNPKVHSQIQSTRKLIFNSNINCEMIIDGCVFEKAVHIIVCLSNQYEEQLAFVRLTESFSKYITANNPYILSEFFTALVNLFAQGGKVSELELQGLFSELYTIYYFLKLGINIGSYWQKQDKMNFDFTINNTKRIEIKSTTRSDRIHHFKHEQLLSEIYDIMIISYLLRKDDAGISLFELIQEVREVVAQDYKTLLYIEQLIKNISEDDLKEIKYDERYIENNIRFFPASNVPRFNEVQPDGVTQTEYNSNLSTAVHIPINCMIEWLNERKESENV